MLKPMKKIVPLSLSAVMALSLAAGPASAAETGDALTPDTSWYNESDSTYTIKDADDMLGLASLVDGGNNFAGKTIVLDSSIDLTGTGWKGARGTFTGGSAATNSPTATGKGFAGTFDGGNKTLTVDIDSTDSYTGGLFSYLEPDGTIQNLTVAGTVDVTCAADNENGVSAVGGVVGYNSGIIDHVASNVTVTGGSDVYNVGGIAGFNDAYYTTTSKGTIRNSVNTGSVTGYEKVGGITGENAGLIASCSNGLASGDTIESAPVIIGTSDRKAGVGGIAGRNGNNDTAVETGKIYNCYNTGAIRGGPVGEGPDEMGSWIGGLVGFQNSLSSIHYAYSVGSAAGYENSTGAVAGSNDNASGIVNCYALTGSGSEALSDATITDGTLYKNLTATSTEVDESVYGTWEKGTYYPTLQNNASADATTSPGAVAKTVYLDGTAADNGDGTAEKPFNNLTDAANAASGGTVMITGTVTISEGDNFYISATIKRGDGFNGAMFVVDVPNNEYGVAYVTMTSATIDGSGTGTIFDVEEGRLRLRGNIKLENCAVGVEVADGAQLDLNYTTIDASEYSIKVADVSTGNALDTVILDEFEKGEITINGAVYLGSNAYLTVWSAVDYFVDVECKTPAAGLKVGAGEKYTLTSADAEHVRYVAGAGYDVVLDEANNELVLAEGQQDYSIYLDGTAADNGTGVAASPFNNVADAVAAAGVGGTIVITGTVTVSDNIYDRVTFVRGEGFTDPMFVVNAQNSDFDTAYVTMTSATIDGQGEGTLIEVEQGRLRLRGGITLQNAELGVVVTSTTVDNKTVYGELEINYATINNTTYSVWVDSSKNTFIYEDFGTIFTPDVQISGIVYLGGGAVITLNSDLAAQLNVVVAEISSIVTIVAVCDTPTIAMDNAENIVVLNGAGTGYEGQYIYTTSL